MEQNITWRKIDDTEYWQVGNDKEGIRVYYVVDGSSVKKKEAEANAKLCASAPEMKSVIDSMQKYLEKEGG
jgi:hypothetical protein